MTEPMWRRYARLIRPRTTDDVDEELALHIELRIRDYVARGMTEAEARAAAHKRFGDLAAARAACIDITSKREHRMLKVQLWDAFVQDIRFALRTLGRQKGWTVAGVLTLALGIGATTVVFSTVSTLLLHPLPYPDARRLAFVYQRPSEGNNTGIRIQITPTAPVFKAWQSGTRTFERLEAWYAVDVAMASPEGAAERLHAAEILPDFPQFTGQQQLLGRTLQVEDAREHRVMIGEGFWRRHFAADRAVLGKTMTLDGSVYEIVGVMPAAFQLPALLQQSTDVWKALDLANNEAGYSVMGRLRPGVTYDEAQADLDAIELPTGRRMSFKTVVVPPRTLVHFEETLKLLTAAVALVLIIACANVAHLLLARGAARQREMAVRAALGAGAGRLRRQVLTESLVLALAGCAGGIALGRLGLAAVRALRPDGLDQLDLARLDTTTVFVTIALALLSGVVFGLVGASQSKRLAEPDGLRAGSRGASSGRSHNRLRSLLVVTEMALSTTLLVGAALFVRSIARLQSIDPGFQPAGLYAIAPQLPRATYPDEAATGRFYRQLSERARAVPGVDAITIAAGAPPSSSFMIGAIQVEGEDPPPAGTTSFVNYNGVTADFFRVMGIPVAQGTTFTDTPAAGNQVIVNEGMVRVRFHGVSPLGKRLRVVFNGSGEWKTIVGVVKDAATGGLLMEGSAPMLYMVSTTNFSPAAILRISRPEAALPALRRILAEIDPRLPAIDIVNVEAAMKDSIAGPRFTMTLIAVFTVLAVVLAAIGLYGLVSYAVAQRTREIGIRIALGATRQRIARAVLGQGLVLGVVGMALGLVAARFGTKLIAAQLSGIAATDPVSFTAAGVVLIATILLACIVPMMRAIGVSPQIAMQAE